MRKLIKRMLRRCGYDVIRWPSGSPEFDRLADFSTEEKKTIALVKPFTMTGVERIAALMNAVTYLITNRIPGDFVECGVWRGGSMMAVALTLLAHKDTSRTLYLYDTFEGMPAPTERDVSHEGTSARSQLERDPQGTGVWCYAGLEDVQANLVSTGYPRDKIRFIKGKVQDTIPQVLPAHLALLRLDTDWYESTRHELNHLYPLLDPKGVLIVDDYGHWRGQRQAVDEYFREQKRQVYLHRIDYSARIAVGTGI
jgi:O-methyltransferase